MTVVRWAMWLAPFAVFGLIVQMTSRIGVTLLLGMGVYIATVLLGFVMLFIVYLVLLLIITRRSMTNSLRSMHKTLLLAFSTSSSAAIMPLSIKTAEEKFGVRPSISQLVVPLSAAMNMSGTALYQSVATLFLAQIFGVEIGLSGLLLVVFVAVGVSIGSSGTPGVGLIILSVVLGSIGIPAAAVALIMGVDRILDMSRTALNVAGDLTACILMDRWVGGKRSAGEQLAQESAREWQRKAAGRGVLQHPVKPQTVKGSDYI